MQSAIETGRLIRDRKNISLKTPLSCVTLVDQDPLALQDFKEVQSYIMDELNCLELKTEADEDAYVVYQCEPDNRLIGQALKKAYDKKMKAAIAGLPSAQLREYLKNGTVMLGDVKLEEGWLKVEKVFNDKYKNSEEHGCASDARACVLLRTVLDDNLKMMGQSREVTNRIQKLRKSSGISIDDQIEVFYQETEAKDGKKTFTNQVIELHSAKIQKSIKMPFHPAARMPPNAVLIEKTTYENPDDPTDSLTLYITKPTVQFDEAAVLKLDGAKLDALRSYCAGFSTAALKKTVQANNGTL